MQYREVVLRTAAQTDDILLACLGLAGEVGEFIDDVKKIEYHGHKLDRDKLLLELGDVRWYLELALIMLGSDINEIEQLNRKKLEKRYPDGFESERSINRTE